MARRRFFQAITVVEILAYFYFVDGASKNCPENQYFDVVTSNCHPCKECCPPRPVNEYCSRECNLDNTCNGPIPTTKIFHSSVTATWAPSNYKTIAITIAVGVSVSVFLLVILMLVYCFYIKKKRSRLCPGAPCEQEGSGEPAALCVTSTYSHPPPNTHPGPSIELAPILNDRKVLYERNGDLPRKVETHSFPESQVLLQPNSLKLLPPHFRTMPMSLHSPPTLQLDGKSYFLVPADNGNTDNECQLSIPTPCTEDVNREREEKDVETDVKKPIDY